MIRSILMFASVPAIALLTGCASDGEMSSTHNVADHAVMCPKCETVWVKDVQHGRAQSLVNKSRKEMMCPDCDKMATARLEGDGSVILHNCPMCKVAPVDVSER